MRWIKDSVHGEIPADGVFDELIDCPEMQRLRRISDTAFVNLIYPGANHTRFEHSLGTYHLTSKFADMQDIDAASRTKLEIYALLHDVGHCCFSHALEDVVKRHTGKNHEQYTEERIRTGAIRETLEKFGFGPEAVVKISQDNIAKLLTGDLGTDRMDYLLRDAKYTGVAYGGIDYDRIMRKMRFIGGKLVLDITGLASAEALLISRFHMFPSVYGHHVPKAAELMMANAVEMAIENKLISAEELVVADDWQLVSLLRDQEGYIGNTVTDILCRKLYKRALQKRVKDFDNWLYLGNVTREKWKDIGDQIADKTGLKHGEVVIHIPKPWFGEIKQTIYANNDFYDIEEVSLICRVLKEAQWDYCYLTVLCPQEKTKEVGAVAQDVIKANVT